jgi:tRNA(Arg) A34 adenosine deaminase TadA
MTAVPALQAAVALAAAQAEAAHVRGTFGVGGVMLDAHGALLQAMPNRVIENGMLLDPTAHGERQLVDWYFARIAAGASLPPPSQITVVTSVDPCCMCAGALLAAGFRVVVAANDGQAGVNYDAGAAFPALPDGLRAAAQALFSYPEVGAPSPYARAASGAPLPSFFLGQGIDAATQTRCVRAFEASAEVCQQTIHGDLARAGLLDPRTLAPDHPLVLAVRSVYRDSLGYTCAGPQRPDAGLIPYLRAAQQADRAAGGDGDACALLDAFGNLVLCLPGALATSPIQTAYMRCVRAYSLLRHRLRSAGVAQAERYLGHPKHGTLLLLRGPDHGAASFMTLGAYGSTMEGPLPSENPHQFQYVQARLAAGQVQQLCEALPPLYRHAIKVMPSQVDDAALISAFA